MVSSPGPLVWALSPFEGPEKGTSRVYIRYVRIPGLRAHTRGPWVHPKNVLASGLYPKLEQRPLSDRAKAKPRRPEAQNPSPFNSWGFVREFKSELQEQ